jgi:hypothetical protein
LKAEWFIEMPPAIVERILCAMALPLDKSIPTERDRFVEPEVDIDRLPAIARRVSVLLQEASTAEFKNSWGARTRIRAALDRVLTKLRSLRAILVASDAAIVASISAAQNMSRDRDVFSSVAYGTAWKHDALGESNLWSRRSSSHPRQEGGASPDILASNIADAVAHLKDACDYASQLSGVTSPSIESLLDLEAAVTALLADLETSEFAEALRLSAVNLFAERKYRGELNTLTVDDFDDPERTVEWIYGCSGLLFDAVHHLDLLIEEYDSADDAHDHPWLTDDWNLPSADNHHDSQLPTGISPSPWSPQMLLKETRRHLAPFLQDGRSTAPGTSLLLSIAELYDYIFEAPFNLYVRDQARYDDEVGQANLTRGDNPDLTEKGRLLEILDYEINDAMKFACSVIKVLELEGVISRYGEDDVGFDPEVHGLDELPTKYDIQRHQRLFWTNAPDPLPDFLLVCKLGDIWKRSRRRTRETAIPT